MKKCPACGEAKNYEEFTARGYTCKPCHNLRSKASYQKNKAPYIKRARLFRKTTIKRLKAYINELKSFGCSLCNEKRYWCIDFHHKDRLDKDYGISELVGFGSINKVIKELDRCILVCKNCHSDIHYRERVYTSVPVQSPKL